MVLHVSPHPDDELIGAPAALMALRDAGEPVAVLALGPDGPPWWQRGLWRELPAPNLIVGFSEHRLMEILHALDAHAGELDRNDYRRLVRGRAMAAAVLGPERVLGWGSLGLSEPYAELLRALSWRDGALRPEPPRILDGQPRHDGPA